MMSTTDYYHEIKLDDVFRKDETLKGELNMKTLFNPSDTINPKLIKQYLPSVTMMNNVLVNINDLLKNATPSVTVTTHF